MISLLDVNLLIALAWPNHVHHASALHWFKQNQSDGWATCPVTQSGFVRISSNSRVLPDAKTPREALNLLKKIVALRHHVFWPDDISIADSEYLDAQRLQGHRQVTDAHLVALALARGGRFATLDAGVQELVPKPFSASERVCLAMAAD